MLEYDGIKDTAYRRSNQQGLPLCIAVSIALHLVMVAFLLPQALQRSSREETVEVFVLGEGGGQAGTKGAAGKAGERLAGTDTPTEKSAQAGNVITAVPESRLEISRVLEAKLKKDRAVHNERAAEATETALKIETPLLPSAGQHSGQPAAAGIRAASSGANKQVSDGTGGSGTAGSGIGSGAPFGSAGSGVGTGDGGTGVTAFGSADAPRFLRRILPAYPSAARMRGEEGRVVLKLTIDEDGTLKNIDIVESTGAHFTQAAVEAIKRSSFVPAQKNKRPVLSVALLPLRFTLR